jgi:predicted DCC family thiol-disulfide oxidoreductase YuxK
VRAPGTARESLLSRARAVGFVFRSLPFPWRALAVLLGVVPRGALDAAYDLVARARYPVFGRKDRCAAPPPDFEERFLA